MFGWLKRKAHNKIISSMEDDMNGFIKILKGLDDEDIGATLVGATWVRHNLQAEGQIPPHILTSGPVVDTLACNVSGMKIGRAAKNHQGKDTQFLAGWLMVWLHSIRALGALEVRPLGQELWLELGRGMGHLEQGYEKANEIVGMHLGVDIPRRAVEEATFIPKGLE